MTGWLDAAQTYRRLQETHVGDHVERSMAFGVWVRNLKESSRW